MANETALMRLIVALIRAAGLTPEEVARFYRDVEQCQIDWDAIVALVNAKTAD